MSTFPPELLTTFRAMAEVVYAGESHETVHQGLCDAAVELIDGCDHASLMFRRKARVTTTAASDDVARQVDDFERAAGQGPCIDAIDESEPDQHFCPDLTVGSKWPGIARRVLEETPVRGMAGFRIRLQDGKVGALNVFSDTAGALTEHSMNQASMLTAFASVALAAQERGEEASTLRRGLESNREIGKAIGLMMALHGIDDEAAFGMLSTVSQEMNIKLADVAAKVISHHRKGSGS
ncbi:MAG: GAF and ANTAR domain-containing protein [Marmoricola sp.]